MWREPLPWRIVFVDSTMTPRGLSNSDGWELARRLLRPRLPHDTHDYILEGLCKAIDGIHVISILQTGGGKSSLFYGYILLIQALNALSPPCDELLRTFPKNPAMVVVFPTKGLEEDMVRVVIFNFFCACS